MEKLKWLIKIIIQILVIIVTYIFLDKVLENFIVIKWLSIIIFALVILYYDLKDIDVKPKESSKELFNTYYINYPKVFEIVMLINNKIKINSEESIKKQNENKQSYGLESSFNINKLPLKGNLEGEFSELINHEYKEIQEIKNTNSTYLREIIKKCKHTDSLENLKNGDLIKINNVKLEILNPEEILQANSIISGAFNDNIVDTYSNGQSFKINVSSLTNMVLKDYKYYLKGNKSGKDFYIDIPMKAEKEFENEYSIYDLEIGLVNIIGIYRTNKYNSKNKTTFSKLQELGNEQSVDIDEMKSSRKEKNNDNKILELKEAPYVDLIAIIQDLSFQDVGEKEDEE